MTSKLTDLAMQLAKTPTICNWFQYFAQETWDRIGFVRTRRGLRIWETTITQNMLFEYHTSQALYNAIIAKTWGIEMLESVNEKAHGNDIELFVETKNGFLFFAVQAKIINHDGYKRVKLNDGNYSNMNHIVDGQNQIDLLCAYAKSKKGLPLYLLYNFVKNTITPAEKCNVKYSIEQFGCSLVNAEFIKNKYLIGGIWTIPTFNQLHPKFASPWFVLPCCSIEKSNKELLNMLLFEDTKLTELRTFTLSEIQSDSEWNIIRPFYDKETDTIESSYSESDEPMDSESIEFIPKYRIILSPRLSVNNKPSS